MAPQVAPQLTPPPPNGEGAGGGPGTSQNVFAKHIMVLFLMIFGRTELIISVSEANFDEEADFEIRWGLDPQKACLFGEKHNFRSEHVFLSVLGLPRGPLGTSGACLGDSLGPLDRPKKASRFILEPSWASFARF